MKAPGPLVAAVLMAAALTTVNPTRVRAQPPTSATPPTPVPEVPEAPQMSGDPSQPWMQGTTLDQRKTASALFEQGNTLMDELEFAEADKKYQAAIDIWDHPVFHFNRTIAQINLLQPIEAYKSIEKALEFGDAPFTQAQYQRALQSRKQLEDTLAHVDIRCDQPGVEVTLDGKLLFTAPGQYKSVMRPGTHQLVATRDGYITDTRQLIGDPGQTAEVHVQLVPPERLEAVRKWAAWKPWAVVGAGALVMAGAGFLDYRSEASMKSFDDDFAVLCSMGCPRNQIPVQLIDDLSGARTRKKIALGTYFLGGGVMATGAVLLYLNRERVIRIKGDDDARKITWRPVLLDDGAGTSIEFRF